MILRVYELAAGDWERLAGWPASAGPYASPVGTPDVRHDKPYHAVELALAAGDAAGRPMPPGDRESAVRRLVPWVVERLGSLSAPASLREVLVRCDGWWRRGSLVDVMAHLTDDAGAGCFHFVGGARYTADDPPSPGSVHVLMSLDRLTRMFEDRRVSTGGDLRMRIFLASSPTDTVRLDCLDNDDPRWREVLEKTSLLVSTSPGLGSIFVAGEVDAERVRGQLVGGV